MLVGHRVRPRGLAGEQCVYAARGGTFSRFVVTMTATAEASLVKLYIDMLYAKAANDPIKMIPQPIAGFSLMYVIEPSRSAGTDSQKTSMKTNEKQES